MPETMAVEPPKPTEPDQQSAAIESEPDGWTKYPDVTVGGSGWANDGNLHSGRYFTESFERQCAENTNWMIRNSGHVVVVRLDHPSSDICFDEEQNEAIEGYATNFRIMDNGDGTVNTVADLFLTGELRKGYDKKTLRNFSTGPRPIGVTRKGGIVGPHYDHIAILGKHGPANPWIVDVDVFPGGERGNAAPSKTSVWDKLESLVDRVFHLKSKNDQGRAADAAELGRELNRAEEGKMPDVEVLKKIHKNMMDRMTAEAEDAAMLEEQIKMYEGEKPEGDKPEGDEPSEPQPQPVESGGNYDKPGDKPGDKPDDEDMKKSASSDYDREIAAAKEKAEALERAIQDVERREAAVTFKSLMLAGNAAEGDREQFMSDVKDIGIEKASRMWQRHSAPKPPSGERLEGGHTPEKIDRINELKADIARLESYNDYESAALAAARDELAKLEGRQ